jgi:hypothetical protein
MFNFSAMNVRNRLAADGDELVVLRFDTGLLGLVLACDLRQKQELARARRSGFWRALREFMFPVASGIALILVPPGTRLLVRDIPINRQLEWRLRGETQVAVATILTGNADSFRDAIGFSNGTIVLVGRLVEGQRVRVLSASSEEEANPSMPEFGVSVSSH